MLSCFSHAQLFLTPGTVTRQASLSMGFSRQDYLCGLLYPQPGDLPNSGIKLRLLHLLHWQAGSLPLVSPGKPVIKYWLIVSRSVFRLHRLGPSRLLRPWGFSGKNTGMGTRSLLQGIFPTQGSNLGLLCCRQILYHLSYQRSPFYYFLKIYLIDV